MAILLTGKIGLFILLLLRIVPIWLFHHDLACFGLATSSLFHRAPSALHVLLPLGQQPRGAPSPKEFIAQCLTLLFCLNDIITKALFRIIALQTSSITFLQSPLPAKSHTHLLPEKAA